MFDSSCLANSTQSPCSNEKTPVFWQFLHLHDVCVRNNYPPVRAPLPPRPRLRSFSTILPQPVSTGNFNFEPMYIRIRDSARSSPVVSFLNRQFQLWHFLTI